MEISSFVCDLHFTCIFWTHFVVCTFFTNIATSLRQLQDNRYRYITWSVQEMSCDWPKLSLTLFTHRLLLIILVHVLRKIYSHSLEVGIILSRMLTSGQFTRGMYLSLYCLRNCCWNRHCFVKPYEIQQIARDYIQCWLNRERSSAMLNAYTFYLMNPLLVFSRVFNITFRINAW